MEILSELEKKALYNLKDMFENIEIKEITKDAKITIYGKAILDILIAINLIEKQQEELEQEKEKNKSLKKQIKKMQEYYKNADFIFKDKIKEKIEEIKSNEHYNYVGTEWSESEVVGMLEDLLEV